MYIVGTYHTISEYPRVEGRNRFDDKASFPAETTLGFRSTFWKAFASAATLTDKSFDINWLGLDWRVLGVWIFEGGEWAESKFLADQRNIFVVVQMVTVPSIDAKALSEIAFRQGVDEQASLSKLVDALAGTNAAKLSTLSTLRHERALPARLIVPTDATSDLPMVAASQAAIVAFSALGQLMVWQIDREHAAVSLESQAPDIHARLAGVLAMRARLINLERLFLTKNISNSPRLAVVARDCGRTFDLHEKIRHIFGVNDVLERYFLTANQIRQSKILKTLNITALMVAVIGLPTAIMSMLISLSETTPIVKAPLKLLMSDDHVLFFAVSLACCLSFVLLLWFVVRASTAD